MTNKLIKYIIFFLILTFSGDRLLELLINVQIINKSNFRYSRLYSGNVDCDILLLGNSRGLSFYQPKIEEITGKKTFNLSYNGLPTNLAHILLEDFLRFNKKPKLVLIEATMSGSRPELISDFSCYASKSDLLNSFIKEKATKNNFFYNLLHLYRFNGEVFLRCLYYLNKSDKDWLNNRNIKSTDSNKKIDPIRANLNSNAISDYKKIINLCKRNNIKYKFIINPYFPKYREQLINFEKNKILFEEKVGVDINDYSNRIKAVNFFADYLHINLTGGKEYMKILAKDGIFE